VNCQGAGYALGIRNAVLLCTVRDCRAPLAAAGRQLVCANGHAFDMARSGYANLLQPQERRSKNPGDSAEVAAARRRVRERGIGQPLLEAMVAMLAPSVDDVLLDAGCGDGWFLGELQRTIGLEGHGTDISTPAIDLAARRYPDCTWTVANADRFLPYADASMTKLTSITARMNPAEFRRVLRGDGRLLVAVAAPDDLIELRGEGKERVDRTVETFNEYFTLIDQQRLTTVANIDEETARDLRLMIYRPRGGAVGRVTMSLDVSLFSIR
jgi:23S rRNA (guanine745-N1)-methyltransferase